ncbi:cytochrome c-type biogenesis protein CcmB [Ferroglobus placidus DSM 10642]|uniref:Cytochrome c-type biogenesis protein CcmB n=1 Tax=Ferroglobus placidus (strain DSM 10642 / AEDII12DO) TaxID=589924 RepID=D3S2K1_FERPA|nr:heme exporter protein CcmB [Ferroglobus placidus]ADC64531.1 cytochrome c-type biogenesis protein CcmB [Ferroglobus placidus DSM 10642]
MKVLEIAKKDIKVELRTKNSIYFMLLFALISSAMFSVSIPVETYDVVASPLLWIVLLFVGMLGYSRAFLRELEAGTLDGLRISPVNPISVLFGKTLYNLFLMLLVEAIIVPIFFVLFQPKIENTPLFLLSLTAGNVAFVIVSSSLSVLILKSKTRELLMPVILFPVIFPVISSTLAALNMAKMGTIGDIYSPLALIVSFSVAMIGVAFLTFEHAFFD